MQMQMQPHWRPRFVMQGVDINDLDQILAAVQFEAKPSPAGLVGTINKWESWCKEWSTFAEFYENLAEEHLLQNHFLSAGELFYLACIYYHFGQFTFYQFQSEKHTAQSRKIECYHKAMPLLSPPVERVEIAFKNTVIPCNLRFPAKLDSGRIVVIIPGVDSSKEEFRSLEDQFLLRGIATLSFDGPGQGETWHHLKFCLDYEDTITKIIDYLESRSELHHIRVGVLGLALGGHFAPKVAAIDDRVRALAMAPIRYDFSGWDTLSQFVKDSLCYVSGFTNEHEAKRFWQTFSLSGVLKKIKCPTYIQHGSLGTYVPKAELEHLVSEMVAPVSLMVFERGDHLCSNIQNQARPKLVDWFVDHL